MKKLLIFDFLLIIFLFLLNFIWIYSFNIVQKQHLLTHYTLKSPKNEIYLYMNVAPSGSVWELQNKRVFNDPINNMPWGVQVPFFRRIEADGVDNYWRKFLEGEWTYLNHKNDVNRPAGVIEGGAENYEGMGVELPKGVDRQRTKKMEKIYDHGVQWRQNIDGTSIRFDLHPDGNQDLFIGDSDEQLEERQWGTWGSSGDTEDMLESGWREPIYLWDPVGIPHPWTHKKGDVQEISVYGRSPSSHIPHPSIDWEMAAYDLLGDIVLDPYDDPVYYYNLEKQHLEKLELDLLSLENEEEFNKKKTFGYLPKDLTDGLRQVDKKLLKAILLRTRDIIKNYLEKDWNNMNLQLEILNRREEADHLGGAIYNLTYKQIKNKTISFNNSIYSASRYTDTYSEKLTHNEMAEMFHYTMTEMKREGRHSTFAEQIVSENDVKYELKYKRNNFPALVSIYKPLWANDNFGEEFGDAIKPKNYIDKKTLFTFGKNLPISNKTNNSDDDLNYLDEYS